MIKDFNKIAIISGEHNVSYAEMLQRIGIFAGITPNVAGEKTIIFSENREGWVYAFFSVWHNRGIAVPVDSSSTVGDLLYVLNDCTPSGIWTSKSCLDVTKEAVSKSGLNINIMLIDDYESASVENAGKCSMPEPDTNNTAIIIYTSGTTGSPKGVMLSYANLFANIRGVADEVPIFNDKRRTLVLLPLHHVLPLMGSVIAPILRGGGIIICPTMTGKDIMDCLNRGKVGIIIGVPRLWQTLYSGIKKKIDEKFITKALFNLCQSVGSRSLSRFVFQSIRKKMGGNIDYCVSGGAALDSEIGKGMKTLGLDVLEGYGMTETAPIISFTRPDDIIPGCAGLPLPSVECKIIDGELCAKGPNVMQGYYNRPEETAAVIDKDGFIHTGDLARFDSKGRVYITGRSKEIIVLSNGKNVQPSEIEYKLEKYDTIVKEAAVMQDGDMLKAIIVPQTAWAGSMTDEEIENALKDEVLKPYNLTVTNYKKIMSVFVYHGDLPRTKLDKIQRFKLKDIVSGNRKAVEKKVEDTSNYTPEFTILKKFIESEKQVTVLPESHIETDLAFDSLDRVSLQSFIEQSFGMVINADSMAKFSNVQAIADQIAAEKTRMEVSENDWKTILASTNAADLKLPSTSPLYALHARNFKLFFKINNRLTVKGTENIPADGPYILAPNHQSFVDGPLVMSGIKWSSIYNCYFYANEKHVNNGLLRFLAQRNNIILMEQSNLKNSILKMAKVLKQGKNLVIFPEGTRTRNGKIGKLKKTFAILSKELNIPIIPVCIKGAYEAMPKGSNHIGTHKIEVEYLKPVLPTDNSTYDEIVTEVKNSLELAQHRNNEAR